MKSLYRLLAKTGILIVLITVSGCSSTRLGTTWYDTEAARELFRKPLVLALSDTQLIRKKLEDEFVRVLALNGISAEQSYKTFPDLNTNSKDDIKGRLADLGRDCVLVMHLVDVKKEQVNVPGQTTFYPMGGFVGTRNNHFGTYYIHSFNVVSSPGYSYESRTYVLESNLYNAQDEKLIWTAMTETDGDHSIERAVKDFVQVITKGMMQNGLFQPR